MLSELVGSEIVSAELRSTAVLLLASVWMPLKEARNPMVMICLGLVPSRDKGLLKKWLPLGWNG